MAKPKVYIDGQEGTTGLQIYDRLGGREDIELLLIDSDKRKDTAERQKLLNAADLVFLCLPDAAAVEAVSLIENGNTRVIDCSTAHRTKEGWVYGFPELRGQREKIVTAKRVANPGCHATGFISIVRPLMDLGLLERDALLSCFSLTGYSGGGKRMIADYEAPDRNPLLASPCLYSLLQRHKHLPEMQALCGLEHPPVFTPIVDDYYKGMATTVPFHLSQMKPGTTLWTLCSALQEYYLEQPVIRTKEDPLCEDLDVTTKLYGNVFSGKDCLSILIAGNSELFTITALFDNLGKGASGAAVQNMNLMLGFEETRGLNV
ncbi:MAG: N-acetyl-gamma-glutamyl-phosphate reductase [Lawsonibacter sp.]|nr:N-acetyl-gamma-glutamyl-phosphate reductase [Lawsonibacter sp.]